MNYDVSSLKRKLETVSRKDLDLVLLEYLPHYVFKETFSIKAKWSYTWTTPTSTWRIVTSLNNELKPVIELSGRYITITITNISYIELASLIEFMISISALESPKEDTHDKTLPLD